MVERVANETGETNARPLARFARKSAYRHQCQFCSVAFESQTTVHVFIHMQYVPIWGVFGFNPNAEKSIRGRNRVKSGKTPKSDALFMSPEG
ncbi:UNVERIFIED_CONTAM: hypothetical protein FKN15_023181 [Acipenser sinensis]